MDPRTQKTGYVYIISNITRNVLYVSVTSDLTARIWQHRNGNGSEFTARYNLKYLIYYEEYPTVLEAIEREKQLKNWNREWKLDLIRRYNPELRDLWHDL